MTINMKMSLVVVLALVGVLALAAVARSQIARVYDTASFGTVNSVPGLLALDDAQAGVLDEEKAIGQLALASTDAELHQRAQKIAAAERTREAGFKEYDPTIAGDKDQQMANNNRAAAKAMSGIVAVNHVVAVVKIATLAQISAQPTEQVA